MDNDTSKEEYLDYFISLNDRMELKIEVLYLDREFYTREVFDLVQYCIFLISSLLLKKELKLRNIVRRR